MVRSIRRRSDYHTIELVSKAIGQNKSQVLIDFEALKHTAHSKVRIDQHCRLLIVKKSEISPKSLTSVFFSHNYLCDMPIMSKKKLFLFCFVFLKMPRVGPYCALHGAKSPVSS